MTRAFRFSKVLQCWANFGVQQAGATGENATFGSTGEEAISTSVQVIAGLLQYAVGSSLGATLRMASRLCSAMAAGHYPINFRKYALGPLI